MVANRTLIFKRIPQGLPVAGEDLVIEDRPIDLEAPPPPGGLVVEVLCVSLDPYLRGRMRDPAVRSYAPAFVLGEPVPESAIARVLASDRPGFHPGDLVRGPVPIGEYAVIAAANAEAVKLLPSTPKPLDPAYWLGPLGMPGLTAYSGLQEIGQPKAGETLFVSSAAGAVGQLVGQVAKRRGLRVIGSVGSDEKLDYIVNTLGFDGGFNYKKESPFDALPRLAPEGLDIYFENVGGDHLEAALANMKSGGRIPVCGLISEYNKSPEEKTGIKGIDHILKQHLRVQGFLVFLPDFGPKYEKEHRETVLQWLLDGSFPAKLHITTGIENAAEALVGLLEGKNFGKAVLRIKE